MKRILILLIISTFFLTPYAYAEDSQKHQPPEPRIKVITRPQWISGQVAVHVFSFPNDGATLQSDTVIVQVAVWGVEPDRPVYLILDGEEAGRIETPGYYRYEWDLQGPHHLTFRDDYTLFSTAEFKIAPPPPPIPTIPVEDFKEKLHSQFLEVVLLVSIASALGVVSGVQLKKKTKIMSHWTLTPLSLVFTLGAVKLDEVYFLVPYSLVTGLVYLLARGYAREQAILVAEEGVIDITTMTLDDNGYQVQDIGPRYWRQGFIKRRKIKINEYKHPIDLDIHGGVFKQDYKLRVLTVKGHENVKERDGKLVIECSPELSKALADSDVIEKLENQVADSNFKLIFMERALMSLISEIVLEMENIVGDMKLDKIRTVGQAQKRVSEATKKMKKVAEKGLEKEMNPEMEAPLSE